MPGSLRPDLSPTVLASRFGLYDIWRPSDQLIGKIEASKRVHCGDFQRVVHIKIGKQARNALREHGLADSPVGRGRASGADRLRLFAGPLGFDLTHDVCQVETTVRVLAGPLADHFEDALNRRYRNAL